ncbi:hypothetical protein ALC56_07161 [Trachymyrmex septentrionalis]|uniref:Uncharacterized protein n=1 Tax=Trachymyrmex septentrionalis TaxID=34720 RepID=A0A151JWR7_9HYME|nr:hypothetical protein ALC56_07161 [Trachymyrmex septentrionalis]
MVSHVQKIMTYALHSPISMRLFHLSEYSVKSLRYTRIKNEKEQPATCQHRVRYSQDAPTCWDVLENLDARRMRSSNGRRKREDEEEEEEEEKPSLRKQHIDDIASTSSDDGTTAAGRREESGARRLLLSLSSRKRREARTRKEGHRARTRNKRERTDENERISRALTTDMVASRGRFDLGIELVGAGRGTRCAAEDLRLRKKGAPKWGAQLSCGMSGPG